MKGEKGKETKTDGNDWAVTPAQCLIQFAEEKGEKGEGILEKKEKRKKKRKGEQTRASHRPQDV